jgi:hypothetical protein
LAHTFLGGALTVSRSRARGALVDIEGPSGLLPDVRVILNWPPAIS